MNCMIANCSAKAAKKIKFKILPRVGDSAAEAEPGVCVCNDHATEERAKDMLVNNEPGKKQIEAVFGAQGLASPDWDRSYAEWVSMH